MVHGAVAGRDPQRETGEDETSTTKETGLIRDSPNSPVGTVSPTRNPIRPSVFILGG